MQSFIPFVLLWFISLFHPHYVQLIAIKLFKIDTLIYTPKTIALYYFNSVWVLLVVELSIALNDIGFLSVDQYVCSLALDASLLG